MQTKHHQVDSIELINSIDKTVLTVRTKSLEFSFNELADMYEKQELIISPEYQRLFRWSETLQSQFIESVILELPIPPIFIVEREDRVWELIDGLQRMSSWLHFRGILPDEEAPLKLKNCDIVTALNGMTFDNLPQAIKIKLKRSPIRVEIIGKESSDRLKYDMFRRLNTNGLLLSPQEIRNCTIRLLKGGDKLMQFIIELSKNKHFVNCIDTVQEYEIDRKYSEQLVLHFFALKNNLSDYSGDLPEFITKYAEKVSENSLKFDTEKERKIFDKTFFLLEQIMGKQSFASSKNGEYRTFYFEAFTLGIQGFLHKIKEEHYLKLSSTFKDLKNDDNFQKATNTRDGKKKHRLESRINSVIEILQKIVG